MNLSKHKKNSKNRLNEVYYKNLDKQIKLEQEQNSKIKNSNINIKKYYYEDRLRKHYTHMVWR
jgi:hypothetical protein